MVMLTKHFSAIIEQEGSSQREHKLISNLRGEHGMVGLSIYTKENLYTDHVCTYLVSKSDY